MYIKLRDNPPLLLVHQYKAPVSEYIDKERKKESEGYMGSQHCLCIQIEEATFTASS